MFLVSLHRDVYLVPKLFHRIESSSEQNQTVLRKLWLLVEFPEFLSHLHNTLQDLSSVLSDAEEHVLWDFSTSFLKLSAIFNLFEDGTMEWFACRTCGSCHEVFDLVLFNFSILIYID